MPTQTRPRMRLVAGLAALWLVLTVPLAGLLYLTSSRHTVVAGHDAVVTPTLDGYATLDLGPFVPSFRVPTGSRLGAWLDIGPTELKSYEVLVRRYAVIASQPEGQVAKVRSTVVDMLTDSLLLGGLLALAGPGIVLLVGRRRWAELRAATSARHATIGVSALVLAVGVFVTVRHDAGPEVGGGAWQPLPSALPDVPIPPDAAHIQIESGLLTSGTKRLVESAVDSYRRSLVFYRTLADEAPDLGSELHQPGPDEVVAVLVSDRHDNVGMDPVARAVADAGGATFLLDAGDDTSTGSSWESFSIESLDRAFDDYDHRYAVAGNHDNGDFVVEYLDRLGFLALSGDPVTGPDGIRLLGASDVRSSGLGSWRDERGVTFAEQQNLLADAACKADADGERIATLLVHDVNSGRLALERGCVDLVVGGHLHLQVGPDRVLGENGRAGYSYTNGTTGGAAYALAIGTKLRRDAEISLVTYREGRPVGIQGVTVRTSGQFVVGAYQELDLEGG